MAVAVECLGGHDLEVVVAWTEAVLAPVVEVSGGGHGTGAALVLTDGEELGESARASDGWLVVASAGADVVVAAVRVDGAEALQTVAWVVAAEGFDDVVLGLGRVQPSVDGEVRSTADGIGTREVDGASDYVRGHVIIDLGVLNNSPSCSLRPTNTNDEIVVDTLVPVHGEGTSIHVGAEGTKVAVVVLDVVDAIGTALLQGSVGLSLSLWDWGGEGGGQEASQCCSELHVG
jgi:hypothetical protein